MTIDKSFRYARVALSTLALLTIVSGCTPTGGSTGDNGNGEPTATYSGEIPEFAGPHAAEFTEWYSNAESDFVRTVLEDEEITDAEYGQMSELFGSCLGDQGITFNGFDADGGYNTTIAPNGGDTDAIVEACSRSAGENAIAPLYKFTRQNPDNLDWSEITVSCLIRSRAVPQSYDEEEFEADNINRFNDLDSLSPELKEALLACDSDPLGAYQD